MPAGLGKLVQEGTVDFFPPWALERQGAILSPLRLLVDIGVGLCHA